MNSLRSYILPAVTPVENGAETAIPTPPDPVRLINKSPGESLGRQQRDSYISQPSSHGLEGDSGNASQQEVLDTKCDIMVNWLHQQQMQRMWTSFKPNEGVVLKKSRANYKCSPEVLEREVGGLFDQIASMNVKCALTVNTRIIKLFLTNNMSNYIPLPQGQRLQVLPSIAHLPRCQRHHFGAFIQDQQLLVVWDDQPTNLLLRAEEIEKSLMSMIWDETADMDEKTKEMKEITNVATLDLGDGIATSNDLEEAPVIENRPTLLMNATMVGMTLALLIAALGLGWRALAQEISIDEDFTRLALLVVTPAQIFVSLFFIQSVVVNLAQIFGPISQLNMDSKFYSGKPPRRLNRNTMYLPHVTIQMPVYKEGLTAVIKPSILSLKAAISTYELQGGSANIFVNDDGMQLIPEDQARARRDFYDEHNVGWVARPAHNPKPGDGEKAFIRRGKFKKASNMNYALMVSNKVEEQLTAIPRLINWGDEDEATAYNQCLSRVLGQEEGRAWAAGNIRIGDYILLIDADTRVPTDCLLDATSEMEQSPGVGILQYSSGVMQVTTTFFENGVTFFTNLIYTAIRYTVASGDLSPFVGHNAILRWSAIQQVSYEDEDGYEKFWSESHVSEDFDMSLRLQIAGYIIRLGSYTGDGFKEGVSLTVYDELSRWEKYAYGCNELLFHPLRLWIFRGPFTPLFRTFLTANIPLTSKITVMAYIGTYYAIGGAWILTVANYFLMGWLNGYVDHYYLDSFKVYFSLIIVFSGLGNVALAVLRYRLTEKSLVSALLENFKWLLLLALFLGGISLHLSQALLCHFLEIDMSWGATAKEVEDTTFFKEMPKLLKRFKGTFIFCFLSTIIMAVGALALPYYWRITDFVAIYPFCTVIVGHFLLPMALNPALMTFTW